LREALSIENDLSTVTAIEVLGGKLALQNLKCVRITLEGEDRVPIGQ